MEGLHVTFDEKHNNKKSYNNNLVQESIPLLKLLPELTLFFHTYMFLSKGPI